jgi:putative oxidoreductase
MKTAATNTYDPHASAQSSPTGTSAAHGIALLRISLGVMWLAHALLKPLVFTLPGTAQFFASVGIPGWMDYPVFALELLGGIALLFGVYARQVSLLLAPVMLVAMWVHIPNGWLHTSAGGGWEYPAFLASASVALWLIGDGAFALRSSRRFTPDGQARGIA